MNRARFSGIVLRMIVNDSMVLPNLVQLCTFALTEEQFFVIKWALFCDFATS